MTPPSLQCGLMLVHGNHPEALRDLLISWMQRYPLAPLEKEVILVHSNGIAQWLKLALAADSVSDRRSGDDAGGCGIAAALELSLPATFLWQAYRAVLGDAAVPEASPFDKSRLLWRLLRLLPQVVGQSVYAPLRRFLENDGDGRKRFQLAERLADVFDQYQVYRADWLAAWAAGGDQLIDAGGRAQALPDEQRWQAALWRALLADVGATSAAPDAVAMSGRAAVHAAFLRAVEEGAGSGRPPGVPRRVIVFGISALPRQALEVLAALARWTQVLMCVHNPCEYYWADIVGDRQLLSAGPARQARRSGTPALIAEELLHLHAQPLLAAWGKQGRDFIGLLDEYDSAQARGDYRPQFAAIGQRIDLFAANAGATLLQQLQDDIRALRPLHETRQQWPAVDCARDTSIVFHVAHSAQREVEILHDQLLAAFNADPTLRPRDVVVMVPDIDGYVPHIRAVFGLIERHDARYIPFSLADQGRRRGDPLALAIATLVGLPTSRFAASDLLDLLDVPALRLRFGIADDDLPLLHRWIRGANIRWGLHCEQRASLGLPPAPDASGAAPNSWLFGLRRMLLGYAVGADAPAWRAIEPYDEIGGLDAALLGPLARFVERVDAYWRILREPATPAVWCDRLRALLADFFAPEQSGDALTLQQLDSALMRWQEMCDEAALSDALPISVVGDYWLAQLDEGGLAQRFFAGAVTFATLMPMRAIPFRHVCLLGMNDGDYPRTRVPMDFDLMGQDYRPGDRSRREDDRYLFLEALLSARDRLHISWVGRSINDNTRRPPSVLVGQLRDHLGAGWRLAGAADDGGDELLAALTVEHRLQPFCPDYFSSAPYASPLFTYAREWRSDDRRPPAAGASVLPEVRRDEPLTLRELGDFLKSPVRAFFRQRLGVYFARDELAADDQEPFELDGLRRWQLQNELIGAQRDALSCGQDDPQALAAACVEALARIRRRGELPAGGFGEQVGQALIDPMADLFARFQAALARWPLPVSGEQEIRLAPVGAGPELADWVGGLRHSVGGERGRVVLESSALVKDRHYRGDKLIEHWLSHLAAQLAGAPVTTRIVSLVGEVEFSPLDRAQAQAHLASVVAAWHEGLRRPLPLAAKTALAWLKALPAAPDGEAAADFSTLPPASLAAATDAARLAYEGGVRQLGEVGACPYLQRAYPDWAALGASSGGGAGAPLSEFAQLAQGLLRPLLRALPVDRVRSEKAAASAVAGAAS